MRNTWRFNFAVENNSASPQEDVSTGAIGFTVARASKGTVDPYYFPAGSEQEIRIMFGDGGVDYPDIEEAIYYNVKHPLYISGPAGGNSKSPSYYGGIYISKYGIYPFYKVTDKAAPNYLANVPVDEVLATLNTGLTASKKVVVDPDYEVDEFIISNISKTVYDLTNKITLKKGNAIYEYYLDKDKKVVKYFEEDGSVHSNIDAGTISIDENTKVATITIGGKDSEGTLISSYRDYPKKVTEAFDIPNLNGVSDSVSTFTKFLAKAGESEQATYLLSKVWSATTTKVIPEYVKADETENKSKYAVSTVKPFTLGVVLDLSGAVHQYICQKSPTSKVTTLNITNIGYDRWYFDDKVGYVEIDASRLDTALGRNIIATENYKVLKDLEARKEAYYADALVKLGDNWTDEVTEREHANAYKQFEEDLAFEKIPVGIPVVAYFNNETDDELSQYYVFKKIAEEKYDFDGNIYFEYRWEDCTYEYTGLVLQVTGPAEGSAQEDPNDKYGIINNLYKSNGEKLQLMDPDSDDANLRPEEYQLYDTLSFTQTEEVNGSALAIGGTFTGSADPENVDVYGTTRYWLDVLPKESISYVEVYPVSSFSKLSDNGFYTGIKGLKGSYSLQGQRYISSLVEQLRAEGSNGSDISSKTAINFIAPLKEGWAEAKSDIYSEVKIFFESTGFAALRSSVTALRAVHNFATMVGNRRLTLSEFNNIKTLQVSVRKRGCPLYVGEFLVKDTLSGETYYSTLIGSVASLLADDIDEYLGGEAPMWVKVDSLGGQIDREVISARWDFTQADENSDTYYLDKLGVNPIVLTTDYGVMAVSQKTTELNAGDWSSLQHQMAFDLYQRELRDNVMVKLIGKNINDYWLDKAKEWAQPIANKRTVGSRPIWFNAEVYCKSVNNATTKTNKEFILKSVVKVVPSAEKVTLILENTDQGAIIASEA